ncbi:JAB domain-containing protein [Pseudomonas taetrolens]|uniref:JAB domain-containing protein n=1 Tax=Pseudomonas taetrolens TaxID=47884 RepID=UPI0030DDBEE6
MEGHLHTAPDRQSQPSETDRTLTRTLKQLLSQVDVQVLDHVIVGGGEAFSFAEESLI